MKEAPPVAGEEALRLAALLLLLVVATACGRIEATRNFNYGLEHYATRDFEAAARSFERAYARLPEPGIGYNLALARLAWLREIGGGGQLPGQEVATALAGLDELRALPDASKALRAKLDYIEGSIHRLTGSDAVARSAFERSLESQPGFKPALKALVELDPAAETPLARLLLATAAVEPLELETRIPR